VKAAFPFDCRLLFTALHTAFAEPASKLYTYFQSAVNSNKNNKIHATFMESAGGRKSDLDRRIFRGICNFGIVDIVCENTRF
jgi:hypothetical protein